MINVLVISESGNHSQLLSHYSDLNIYLLKPESLEFIIEYTHTEQSPIDIIVIDGAPEEISSDMLCYQLSKVIPSAQSIILIDEEPTFDMLQNSGFKARGYLPLEQWTSLPKAIRVIHAGEAWLPRRLVAEMLNRFILKLPE